MFGRASLTLRSEVRDMISREAIITIDEIAMAKLDANSNPKTNDKT